MHVISLRKLRGFWAGHPEAEEPLRAWHARAEKARWRNFADVRADFPAADVVAPFTVFDIGGNKFRLIAIVDYRWGRVYIRDVLTHARYDAGRWKSDPGIPPAPEPGRGRGGEGKGSKP